VEIQDYLPWAKYKGPRSPAEAKNDKNAISGASPTSTPVCFFNFYLERPVHKTSDDIHSPFPLEHVKKPKNKPVRDVQPVFEGGNVLFEKCIGAFFLNNVKHIPSRTS
jgi:hypothetical protein